MPSQQPYRGRFAPSPSGPLHFGSLVTALGSYLDARHHAGEWLLRVEDLDPPRIKSGATSAILHTLEAFGFEWDGEILFQSQRLPAYRDALSQLQAEGFTYVCSCSRKAIAFAGLTGIDGLRYPGTCRYSRLNNDASGAIRIATDNETITFVDRVHGTRSQCLLTDVGDFVLRRADGLFAYQLAVVVDDAFQGISQVVRGADLLNSTARQIFLQRRLGLPFPEYAHLPLVLDEQGRKLSKQQRADPVKSSDPLPALLAALQFLGQVIPPEKPTTTTEFWAWASENWAPQRIPPINPESCQNNPTTT